MLVYVNLVLVTIVTIVVVVNMVLMFRGKNELQKRINALDASFKKVSPTGTSLSILDHAEFEKLDPKVKELYRKYVVQNIMPRAMNIINKEIAERKVAEEMTRYGEYVTKLDDASLFGTSATSTSKPATTATKAK